MHLSPTPEQDELKAAVRRFCEQRITPEQLVAWDKDAEGIDTSTWRMIADLGWFGIGIPRAAGGSGMGLVEVACILEECARGLVPRRVINALHGACALATLQPASEYLPAVARGEQCVTLAFDEEAGRAPAGYRTRIDTGAAGSTVTGAKWYVADARCAQLHVVSARTGEDVALVLVSGGAAPHEPLRTFDGDRQSIVRYTAAPVLSHLSAPGGGLMRLATVRRQATALALAEMIGGMDAVIEMTVAHVKQREQFGQRLGVFQAVQHQIADMATAHTAARHLAWQAITRVATGSEEADELATAAAFVGQAFKRATLSAHHLHGGAGYVVEHPLHYHAERAQALCIRHTPEAAALAEVAARLLDD